MKRSIRWILAGMTCLLISNGINAQQPYDTATISEDLKKGAHEVVRNHYQKFSIKNIASATLDYKLVVTLLNSQSKANTVFVRYNDQRKVNNLFARVYDASGKEIQKVKGKNFIDRTAISWFTIYGDNRVKYIELNHNDYPYTVEIEYSQTLKRLPFYPGTYLQSYNRSIENFEFIVESPIDHNLRYQSKNIELQPEIKQEETKNIYRWEVSNLAALKKEPFAPYVEKIRPQIRIAPTQFLLGDYDGDMSTWESLGEFMYKLNAGRDELSTEMTEEVTRLVKDLDSTEEKIKVLYNYMQNNMRYVSVQLGIGGWQTFDAKYVEKNKYGDCKVLSNFMKSMLKAAGIESHTAIIYSNRNNKIEMDESFPVFSFANHVILNVPSEDIWLECTSTDFPINYVGSNNQNRQVLLVTEEGGKVINTPTYDLTQNKMETNVDIKLTPEGAATIKEQMECYGPMHEYYRSVSNHFSQKDLENFFQERSNLPSFSIDKLEVVNDEHLPKSSIEYNISVPRYSSKAGKRIFVPINNLHPFKNIPKAMDNRIHPIHIKKEEQKKDRFVFHLPEGYEVESIPSNNIDLDTAFGKYKVDISVEENKIIYNRSLEIYSVELPAERYNDLRTFYKEVAAGDAMKLVLVKKKT